MDDDGFRKSVESAAQTQLERLGSSKLLVALTGANLSDDEVLRVAADSEAAAATVFETWADDASTTSLADAYAEMADDEHEHLDRVLGELGDYEPAGQGAIHDHLQELPNSIDRVAAGFVGRGLIAMRTHTQLTSYFVNEQDHRRAELFRELKADTSDQIARGIDILGELERDEQDWEEAIEAAIAVIQVAYEEYASALDDMGINPKSVC